MRPFWTRRIPARYLIGAAVLCAACDDPASTLRPTPVDPRAPVPAHNILARHRCQIVVATNESKCERIQEAPPASDGARRAIFSGQDIEIRMTNKTFTSADSTYSVDVSLAHPDPGRRAVGTYDGVAVKGVKAFYLKGPASDKTSTRQPGDTLPPAASPFWFSDFFADTTKVRVKNADGVDNFTRPNQPYHFYNQIIDVGEFSAPERWEWTVHPSVKVIVF
ncbi:MAG TPA: hypothetical protein VE913_11910, partial [Longimicrobium sp.]|nr:hypothetical protein [Longimicrobium sp.]